MREAYQITKEELLSGIDTKTGLTTKQALTKLETDGENVLEETKRKSVWSVFIGQFADLLVVILIVAAVISMVSGNVESTIVIFAVIILNSILGTVQYVKAEKSLESLKALSSPHVKVLRDGVKQEYRKVKVLFDLCMIILGFLLGGKLGVITIVTAFTAGPGIQFCADKFKKLCKNTGIVEV